MGEKGGAYLGAVSWVVYNSCLGFLGGGRRHFTMQGGDGLDGREVFEGGGGEAPRKMPRNTNLFHGDKHTKQTRVHTPTQSPGATVKKLHNIPGDSNR